MARIEDLIDEVSDPELRAQIAAEVKHLKTHKRFGLVYEDHVPETVSLFGLPVRPGSIVHKRTEPEDDRRWEVVAVEGDTASIRPVGTEDEPERVAAQDLLTVKRFEEPIYPGLTPVGEVRRGPAQKPFHSVINAENFHALQLLAYTHAGKVDVIYIDPPYNTGDKSWKYNNRFVDSNDSYRHSKWLAMMERRLKLAKELLTPDGVLIVTIDEHEVHNLALLLAAEFPEAYRQMITIVVNPSGVSQRAFARVEEYALFCFLGGSGVALLDDDMHATEGSAKPTPIWFSLVRYGTNALPSDRPGLVYPVAIDTSRNRVVGVGKTLAERVRDGEVAAADVDRWMPEAETIDGFPTTWPVRGNGLMGNWRLSPQALMELSAGGFVRVGSHNERLGTWTISYVMQGMRGKIDTGEIPVVGREPDGGPLIFGEPTRVIKPKTVWKRAAHDAGKRGSTILKALLGRRAFDFPKSPYATLDTLRAVIAGHRDAVVLDFFAGSGTTLHSVAMLNAMDGGSRQCILVTNNDVSDAEATRLTKDGTFVGDSDYEAQGIFESVTKPRVEAAITGVRPDGEPVEGKYLDQYLPDHSYADGFDENVAFFRMDYLEPDLVELNRQYEAIAPMLWMAAGSVGSWESWDGSSAWSAPEASSYAVLFDESKSAEFGAYVEGRSEEITHVWIVTDSHSAFLDLQAELPPHVVAGQLYRDYLRNFVVNVPGVMR